MWRRGRGPPRLPAMKIASIAGCVLGMTLSLSGCGSTSMGNTRVDATESRDVGAPGDMGVSDCVRVCEIFLMTTCSTPAADFCKSAQQNCGARYDAHPKCQSQFAAIDSCAV